MGLESVMNSAERSFKIIDLEHEAPFTLEKEE